MRTTSLRRRVTLAVLALLAAVLVGLGIFVTETLGSQLRAGLQARLLDRAGYAQTLAGSGTSAQALADRLTGDGITATYRTGTSTVYGHPGPGGVGPPGPGANGPGGGGRGKPRSVAEPVTRTGDELRVGIDLPGGRLTLAASEADITRTVDQLVTLELVGGAVTLAVTALLLTRAVRVALRPLDRMTGLAMSISRGRRGARLRPANTRTELGRTAAAFDSMLDALETAETSARNAESDARAAELRMRRFLADASHELRTPIAGLQASAETLLRADPARPRRERLAVAMIRETRRTGRLVDDLLLMARLDHDPAETDPMRLSAEPVDLGALAAEVGVRARLVDPAVTVRVTPPADGTAVVRGDPWRLMQILTNLCDNAVHAAGSAAARCGSGDGTPAAAGSGGAVHITLARRGSDVQVEVSDTGPGVPPADRERIFDRFVRLDPARAENRGGSGLGLPIARALARAHCGDLCCADSTVGARFVLILPAAPGAVPVEAGRAASGGARLAGASR